MRFILFRLGRYRDEWVYGAGITQVFCVRHVKVEMFGRFPWV